MKKWIIALFFLLCLTACGKRTQDHDAFVYYFPLYQPEQTEIFAKLSAEASENMWQLLERYAQMQPPEGAQAAIPEQWRLSQVRLEDSTAIVTYAGTKTSALRTNTAAACILQTLLQLPQVESLHLTAPEQDVIMLTEADILLTDSGMLPQKESIVLYLPDDEGRFLVRQTQTVETVAATDEPEYILSQLLACDAACMPHGTRILGVTVDNEICTVNLSSEFLHNMKNGFHAERLAVYAIVNSLTELQKIRTVDLWVEGAPLEELKFMRLPNGLKREESLNAPTNAEYTDFVLYVPGRGNRLIAVPYAVPSQEDRPIEETVLDALLEFDSLDGARNVIAEETKRLSVQREGSTCIIDLTSEFLDGCADVQQEMLSVHSVIATMCAINGISSVELLVEGLEPDYEVSWLKDLSKPEAQWFAES